MADGANPTDLTIRARGGYAGYSVAPAGRFGERVLHIKCADNTEIPVQNLPAATLNRICADDPEFERFLNGITTPSVHYQAVATELRHVSRAMVDSLREQNTALMAEVRDLEGDALRNSRPVIPDFSAEAEMRALEVENAQLNHTLRTAQRDLDLLQHQRAADTARIRASLASLIDAKRLIEIVLPNKRELLSHKDPVVQAHMVTTNEAYWRLSELLGRIIEEVEEADDLPEPAGAREGAEYPVGQDDVFDALGIWGDAGSQMDSLF